MATLKDDGDKDRANPGDVHSQAPLALPAPPMDKESGTTLEVGGQSIALDRLGPMIVNSDGTISRIHNWDQLSEHERKTSLRLLAKRNKLRMDALRAEDGSGDASEKRSD
ncbi:hypothetical protein IE53DRAFT_112630 [Violaceomyces palustris]|uniref:Uncharacterized protein n=1 Tax=Violaceomyces palustris TaxID=1673888 RepID=A0ACD0P6S7_9BASI|nr:hypothetical protein IE53DRAFT_112630 [Violaceomyces palustris]